MCIVSNFKSLVLWSMFGLLATVPVYAGNINVEYDQGQDKITIQAANASLTQLLAQIANQTSMEIQIDPAVEKTVNFQLPPQPLQQALQKVVKGLSYVIEYKIDEKQQTVISGMKLLPKGIQDSGQLVPVSVLNARASQNNRRGSNDYDGSLNRRGNYYPGSRQSSVISKTKQPTKPGKNTSGQDDTATPSEIAAGQNNNQQVESQPKKRLNDPEINSADIF